MVLGVLFSLLVAALVLARPRAQAEDGSSVWSDDVERRRLTERRNLVPK
jgi:hypothetical protein